MASERFLFRVLTEEAMVCLQDHVAELAGQCEAMLPRLAALAGQITDEVPPQTCVVQLSLQLSRRSTCIAMSSHKSCTACTRPSVLRHALQNNLQTTLTVHGDMEESLIKYRNLLEVAEGRSPVPPLSPTAPKAGGLSAAAAAPK